MRAPKTFEEGMSRLEGILAQLQEEGTSLAASVKLYADAAELIRFCHETLDIAKLQIEEIDAKLNPVEN